jgi:predicted Zn-dependent peptidase
MRTENNPIGKLVEEFLAVAYKSHPYEEPVIGHIFDLEGITRDEAVAFFKKYYVPSSMVIAIVGDVDPKETIRLAEMYFGRIPAGPPPPGVRTFEPEQKSERSVVLKEESQRILLVGYKKGSINHPDNAVYEAISDILSSGRTSRLYKSLVRDKKLAIQAAGFSGFSGLKYPNFFAFFAVPAQDKTNDKCVAAIDGEIAKLKKDPISGDELKAVKTRARADLIRGLSSDARIAGPLTFFQAMTGDWRNLFKQLDKIDAQLYHLSQGAKAWLNALPNTTLGATQWTSLP